MPVDMDVRGLAEAKQKMQQVITDLRGEEFAQGMRDATMIVTRDAKVNAPVDMGGLRASITPDLRQDGNSVLGVVGSNKRQAAAMETGTKPFWPPIAALETWARRHGTTAFVVARAIARRGIRGRRYLQRAFEKNQEVIKRKLGDVVGRIAKK